jgi:universal stress protein A
MKIDRILFPTDFSNRSVAALDYASNLAAWFSATLHIVYVDNLIDIVAKSPYSCPSFMASTDRSQVKAELEGIIPTIANVACVHHFLEGGPAAEICAMIEKERIDLIVMSSHGRTGLSRLLMGSVAECVLRNAACPVLIVKQPLTEPAGITKDVAACVHA